MHYSITFQSVFVPIMIYLSIQSVSKDSQVSDTKSLEEKSHRIEVANQILRTKSQYRSTYRGVNEISGICSSDCGFGAQVRIPRFRVLDNEYLPQRFQVASCRLDADFIFIICQHVCHDSTDSSLRTLVAGIRPQEQPCSSGITIHAINPRNVFLDNRIHIVESLCQSSLILQSACKRPAATADKKGKVFNFQLVSGNYFSGASNKCAKLTFPFDSPDSYRLMGRMVSQLNLPVPE